MKTMIALLAMVAGAQSFACTQYEAQVVGVITKKVEAVRGESCAVKAEFSRVNSSIMCPLDKSDLADQYIVIAKCADYQVGSQLSGVVVSSDKGIYLEQY